MTEKYTIEQIAEMFEIIYDAGYYDIPDEQFNKAYDDVVNYGIPVEYVNKMFYSGRTNAEQEVYEDGISAPDFEVEAQEQMEIIAHK